MEQDEDEDAADTGKYPFKCGTVTFTEKPVYGMVEVARLQELADAVADHARVCKSRVLVTNTNDKNDKITFSYPKWDLNI